ncbi:MAG TPA: 3-deoxy-D-manno-octulosonic acid kinase [Steroidobacteraceae bacterium]
MNEAAAAGEEVLARIAGGAMLYDASCLGHPDPRVFEVAHWSAGGALQSAPGGRGTVAFVTTAQGQRWVLRHYRRGGLVARWLDDRYLFTGESRTRAFAEWRLLRQLRAWHLPVPQPVAARYQRAGLLYRADLVTVELPTRTTLAAALRAAPVSADTWQAVGRCIGALHARGVQHADLNAHNLLLGDDGTVYVLDFDRGRIRSRGPWEDQVLARLQRSLRKVTAGLPGDRFGDTQWAQLLRGVTG